MIEEAKKKIKEEMGKSKNSNVKAIGNYLLTQIEINRSAAEKINNKDKTLDGAYNNIIQEAKKRAKNGCAMIEDSEVYRLAREYFSFEAVQNKILEVEIEEIKEVHEIEEVVKKEDQDLFSVSLDDFM